MREAFLFLATVVGSGFAVVIVHLLALAIPLGVVVWLALKPSSRKTSMSLVRYRANGVVVHRAYSAESWVDVYMPLPFLIPMVPGTEFFFLFPLPPPPVLQRQWVPPAPHLLIEVNGGVQVWMRCTDEAYQRWPDQAAVRVEYKQREDGTLNIVQATWP